MAEMKNIISVENLSFAYATGNSILRNLSFGLQAETFLAIAGPNGAGKTTLMNLLCKISSPDTGSIKIDSVPIKTYSVKELAKKIAVVRQESAPIFDFSVMELVSMGRAPYLGAFGFENNVDRKIVLEALEMTETLCFKSRPVAHLSGGERQRVFIARALAQDTPILLLDEPTSFLDLKHQVGIYDLLKTAQVQKGKTIVAVTHDINLAAQYCDEALVLGTDGDCTSGKPHDVFTSAQIERVFGVRTFMGKVGKENFFLPLGKLAKDSDSSD